MEKRVKVQIRRFSPHQNGKVFAVLMVVATVPLFVLMAVAMWFVGPQVDQQGNPVAFPVFMFLVLPFFYLIVGYITVAIMCALYNFFFRFVGGFEFELSGEEGAGQKHSRT